MNDGTVFLLPSVLPLIVLEYGISFSTAGFVSAIIPFCLSMVQTPVGRIADRLPGTVLLRVGILIVGSGALMIWLAPAFLIPALFIIGVGGSFYHPVGYAYTSRIIKRESTGFALGMQSSSGDIGVLVAFLAAGPMAILAGWRFVFGVWGILCLASVALSSIMFRGDVSPPSQEKSDLSILKKRDAIMVMVLFAILGTIHRIIYTFLPTLFFIGGLSITASDLIYALLIGVGIIGGILSGRLTDKYGPTRLVFTYFALTSAVLILLFSVPILSFSILMVIALGLTSPGLYPTLYYIMREVTNGRLVGTAYGLLLSLGMLSGIIGVTVSGYIIDYSPSWIYVFSAALAMLGALLALKLPKHFG
jgi:FSR family fosmidomycin resistance protein-like MFS transporter